MNNDQKLDLIIENLTSLRAEVAESQRFRLRGPSSTYDMASKNGRARQQDGVGYSLTKGYIPPGAV